MSPRITSYNVCYTKLLRIESETRVRRLRLGSIEPTEINADLIAHIAASRIICPHLHIPLQSGDDAVLQRMRRITSYNVCYTKLLRT